MKLEEHLNTKFCIWQSAFSHRKKDYMQKDYQPITCSHLGGDESQRERMEKWRGKQVEQKNKYKWD